MVFAETVFDKFTLVADLFEAAIFTGSASFLSPLVFAEVFPAVCTLLGAEDFPAAAFFSTTADGLPFFSARPDFSFFVPPLAACALESVFACAAMAIISTQEEA